MKIAVVGGTGELGSTVVDELLRNNIPVRLLVRDQRRTGKFGTACELVMGDVADANAVSRLVEGCSAVHISLRAGPEQRSFEQIEHLGTALVAAAAKRQGLRKITYLSGMLVCSGVADHLPEQRAKANAEKAISDSGLPHAIFRPTYFMETLERHVISFRVAILIGRRLPALEIVAAKEYASMVVKALTSDTVQGTFFVKGPRAVDLRDALKQYCLEHHPKAQVFAAPVALMRILDRLFMGGKLGPQVDLMSILERTGEVGDASLTARVFGPPKIDFDDWLHSLPVSRSG